VFKLNSRSLLALLLLAGAACAQDKPTPREVVDAYLKAIGGKAELEKVKSLRTKGTMTFRAAGQNATFELLQMRPNRSLLITDLAGVAKIRAGYDGKVGWSSNPVTGAALYKGQELAEKAEDSDLAGDLHEAKNYKSMENLGEATFDKKKCWKLKFVRNSGAEVIEYYDAATKLRAGSEREMRLPGGTARVVTTVLEYKTFGKLKHMARFRQTLPDTDVITEIASVEYDKVEEKAFALPADVQALLNKE
jgi:zinc protease